MGQYTEHWARYKQESSRSTLRLFAILLCLPLIALLGFGLSQVTQWAVHVVVGLLLAWLVVLTRLALRSSKVVCPRCTTVFTRGKYLSNCPQCGLRMLQEDPT